MCVFNVAGETISSDTRYTTHTYIHTLELRAMKFYFLRFFFFSCELFLCCYFGNEFSIFRYIVHRLLSRHHVGIVNQRFFFRATATHNACQCYSSMMKCNNLKKEKEENNNSRDDAID